MSTNSDQHSVLDSAEKFLAESLKDPFSVQRKSEPEDSICIYREGSVDLKITSNDNVLSGTHYCFISKEILETLNKVLKSSSITKDIQLGTHIRADGR